MSPLSPEKALIFRITHVSNLPFILRNGIHCRGGSVHDPDFTPIGLPNLIEKRATRRIFIGPGGTLSDYIAFYFTPYSIMLYNIKTGYGEVIQRPNDEIAILVSSLHRLVELQIPFVFTNGHAYLEETRFFQDLSDLAEVDWPLLRSRNFARDPDDPGKKERYQAETLVHRHIPTEALLGIVCYNEAVRTRIEEAASAANASVRVEVRPGWYF